MTCRNALQSPASVMQGARMAYARHALAGEPIEVVVVIDGQAQSVPISDRAAAEMIAVMAKGISSNLTAETRRGLTAMPRGGSRG